MTKVRIAVDTAFDFRQKFAARKVMQDRVKTADGIGAERGNGFADGFSRA